MASGGPSIHWASRGWQSGSGRRQNHSWQRGPVSRMRDSPSLANLHRIGHRDVERQRYRGFKGRFRYHHCTEISERGLRKTTKQTGLNRKTIRAIREGKKGESLDAREGDDRVALEDEAKSWSRRFNEQVARSLVDRREVAMSGTPVLRFATLLLAISATVSVVSQTSQNDPQPGSSPHTGSTALRVNPGRQNDSPPHLCPAPLGRLGQIPRPIRGFHPASTAPCPPYSQV